MQTKTLNNICNNTPNAPKGTETHRNTPRRTEAHRSTPKRNEANRTEKQRTAPKHNEAHQTPRRVTKRCCRVSVVYLCNVMIIDQQSFANTVSRQRQRQRQRSVFIHCQAPPPRLHALSRPSLAQYDNNACDTSPSDNVISGQYYLAFEELTGAWP